MAAPVKETCPDIDKYIKYIKMAIVKDRDLRSMDEKELYDSASSMADELENCIDYLEELRGSNHALREWGNGLNDELETAANQIFDLEQKLEKIDVV
jgi:predicted nuclease with TOPRIM domain